MRMTDAFPPTNYVRTQSAISGVEVWMPAPEDVEHHEVVNFRCPQCAGQAAYSVARGGLTCASCGYYEPPPRNLVGKGAEEFEFKVETLSRAARGWGEARKELECEQCGGFTSVPLESLTHTCPFCGSLRVIQRQAPQDVLRPRSLIPFAIDPATCQERVAAWLGNTWMAPASLRGLAAMTSFTAIYIPFWTFDAVVEADWRAEVGRTESSGSGSNRRTRMVWRWESGHVQRVFDDLLTGGTNRLSLLLLGQISNYDPGQLVQYDPKYLVGIQAQAYNIPLENAWEMGRALMREVVRAECRSRPSTDNVRNFSVQLDYADETWRYILVPLYIAAYQHGRKTYQVLVNGQTGAVAGQRPVDWRKVGLALAALVLPGLIISALAWIWLSDIGPTRDDAMIGVLLTLLILALISLVVGATFALRLLKSALRLDDA
jgi:Zn finger protein HypA/HybF involved in hydrogenase expression